MFGMILVLAALATTPAFALPPASIVGQWEGFSNLSEITVSIQTQTLPGPCEAITGTMAFSGGTDNIQGFYCPSSGRISFARNQPSGLTIQTYSGNVSDAASTEVIAGVFEVVGAGGGRRGEVPFYLTFTQIIP